MDVKIAIFFIFFMCSFPALAFIIAEKKAKKITIVKPKMKFAI